MTETDGPPMTLSELLALHERLVDDWANPFESPRGLKSGSGTGVRAVSLRSEAGERWLKDHDRYCKARAALEARRVDVDKAVRRRWKGSRSPEAMLAAIHAAMQESHARRKSDDAP